MCLYFSGGKQGFRVGFGLLGQFGVELMNFACYGDGCLRARDERNRGDGGASLHQ